MISIFLILASGISDRDLNAKMMYIQSYVAPAIFDVCKAEIPERSDSYDEALIKWQATNKAAISHGRKISYAQESRASLKSDTYPKKQRDAKVAELKALPKPEQIKQCEFWLVWIRSQS